MSVFKAAAIQMRSGADPEKNVAEMEAAVHRAAAAGANYVQTPEMTGAVQRSRKILAEVLKPQDEDPVFNAASRIAAELSIWLHIGSTAIALDNGKVANRAFLFAPTGTCAASYDKIHMFDVDLDNGESWRESAVYQAGTETVIADMRLARLGLSICYDLRFPQLFMRQALAGAEVLTVPAAFTRQTGEAHWHALLRARAIETGSWLVAAAQGGRHEDGRETYGHSIIIDPWGKIVAEADHDNPEMIVAEIDTSMVKQARAKIPNLSHSRDFCVKLVETPQPARKRA